MDITIKQAADFLLERDNYLVVSHTSPDADTIGSAAALVAGLRSIGKKAVAICDEPIPNKLSFLKADNFFTDSEPPDIKAHVSVDTASIPMLGKFADKYSAEHIFDLSIDHHMVNDIPCKRRLLCADYSSCGEIIYELFDALNIKISKSIAVLLYSAISSDSGGFRYSSTRSNTLRYAADLIDKGIDFAKINRLLFETKTPVQMELERIAYNSIEFYYDRKLSVVTITNDDLIKTKAEDADLDSLNQIPRQISGVEVSVVIKPKNDKVKVSLRSNEYFNVAEFASLFGGGGHHHAAGCTFEKDINEVKSIIINAFNGKFQ